MSPKFGLSQCPTFENGILPALRIFSKLTQSSYGGSVSFLLITCDLLQTHRFGLFRIEISSPKTNKKMIGLPTPEKEEEFTVEWATPILQDYFKRTNDTDPSDIKVLSVKAKKNELQGILSITYVVDVEFEVCTNDTI